MRRIAKFALYGIAALATVFVFLVAAGLFVVQTPWFRDKVRSRIVYEIEKATGGRSELGALDFDWRTLTAQVRNLVIHGTETSGEAPLFRADSVTVGLKILSILEKKIDLESVAVSRPQVNLIVYQDGRTNLPQPKVPRQPGRSALDTVLDLAIKRFSLVDGVVQVQMRRMPLNAFGENLRAQIFYEPTPARYRGDIAFRSLDVQAGEMKPLPLNIDAKLVLERSRVAIQRVRLAANESTLEMSGSVDLRSPAADLEYSARVNLKQVLPWASFGPLANRGTVVVAGRAEISGASAYALTGKLQAAGLAFRERGISIEDIRVDSRVAVTPERIDFHELTMLALRGRFDGRAEIVKFRDFRVDGAVRGFALHDAARVEGVRRMVWSGDVSGPVHLVGAFLRGKLAALQLTTLLEIAPAPGANPVQGLVDLAYDQARGSLSFGPSNVTTRFSRMSFSGVLGRQMNASVETTNLDDAEPAIAMFTTGPPPPMPVKLLDNGSAQFQGVVAGPLTNPAIQGHAVMTNFVTTGRQFDRAEADVVVSRSGVVAQNAVLTRLGVRAAGSARVGFRDWDADPGEPVSGTFVVRSPKLADVLAVANVTSPVEATASDVTANVTLGGTLGAPEVTARAQAVKVVVSGQPIDRVQGDVRYTADVLDIPSAQFSLGGGSAQVSARFDHPKDNWSRGRVRFQVGSRGIYLAQLKPVRDAVPDVEGRIETQMAGEISVGQSGFRPGAFNGWVSVRGFAVKDEQLGSVLLTAATKGTDLGIRVEGDLAGSKVTGTTEVALQGDYPVRGHIEFTALRFSTLLARLRRTPAAGEPPFKGLVAGTVDFTGKTVDPQSWKGTVQLPTFEAQPAGLADVPNAPALVVRNTGPVLIDVDSRGARVRQAHFRAKDTNLSVTGRLGFGVRNPWDIRVQGAANLALLQDWEPQIYSSGSVVLDVSVRGALEKPDIYGRIDLRNASINSANFPNGIDNANGVIFLYRDRAMIETLTAQSGGGTISVSGFVSFGGVTTFHLQAKAADVRVRYPAGVSTTSNATLTFSGTTDRSVLAGDVTIMRVGFNPRSDLGTILASAAQPVETPAQPSRFRQGLRFDVRITTSPAVRFETKLTKDIQADASLRLRGDATRPVFLGRVTINQGEVIFFGNKYTITSGQILFVNASKIEPTVNLDLETRARGIDITLHVSGPVNKLNVSYRSDPPLSFSEIVALLTTGREPGLAPGVSGSGSSIGQNWQQAGASALVSQAIASPLTGRLQRFFGVSRLKVDPQVTGLTTNNATARIMIEQNVTSNLTLTYITDLSRAQAQSIRIEWDFTNNWSAVALREENGMFGIDFLYKKQVK